MTRAVLTVTGLDVLYLLTLERMSVPDAVTGALWAALFLWWFHSHVFPEGLHQPARRRFGRTVWLALAVLGRSLAAALRQLPLALRRQPAANAAFVEVPLGHRTNTGIAVAGLIESLSPGSVALDVDERRGVMLIHVVDGSDREAIRRDRETFRQRYIEPVVR